MSRWRPIRTVPRRLSDAVPSFVFLSCPDHPANGGITGEAARSGSPTDPRDPGHSSERPDQ
ncbi:hypothetical protein [Halovivax gelatinilyticus]|uniref:hypothetical protein n=1 Tax=Halovivax gelatinilyticus TaxID=2961597 RepID=UPI0020CA50AA|nr:hypothetical protein [Halovivax gelatinilyticus]